MSTVDDGDEHDGDERAGEAGADAGERDVLGAQAAVVLDAQLDAGEQVGALDDGLGLVVQRVAQRVPRAAHAGSALGSRASSAARPRWRCVLTELREMPSVAAISSGPSSS